jgi:anti-sigma B factor antagonist
MPAPAKASGDLFGCHYEETSQGLLIHVSGDIDLRNALTLWCDLRALLERGRPVVVSLRGIRYMDSSGIKVLVEAHRYSTRSGQRFALAEPPKPLRRAIDVLELEKVIPIYPSVEAAVGQMLVYSKTGPAWPGS